MNNSNNNNDNNNLFFNMVNANRSTLQACTTYNIQQQSATQGSNDTAYTLSHRTAATIKLY